MMKKKKIINIKLSFTLQLLERIDFIAVAVAAATATRQVLFHQVKRVCTCRRRNVLYLIFFLLPRNTL